jgi:hypothetical protein
MKAFRQILIAAVAAVLGFSLGMVGKKPRHNSAPVLPEGSSSSPVAVSSHEADDEAVSVAMSALLDRGNLPELARLGALLDTLNSAQMSALLERVERLPPPEHEVFLRRLVGYWTKRDPQAATEWMQPRLAAFAKDGHFASGFANFDTDLVNTWAENAPELALNFARQHSGTGLSRTILHSAIFAWPDKDYGHRFELLRGFPAGPDRQKVVVSLCFTWAQMDRAAALTGASSLPPGTERNGALAEILARWAAREPAAAFTNAQSFGINDPAVLGVMAKEAAKSHPVATADWLRTQDASLIAGVGPVVATFWAEDDPAAAFTWALEHGVSLTDPTSRNARNIPGDMFAGHAAELSGRSPFSAALREKPAETLAWVKSLPAGPERDRYLELAARDSAHAESVR